MRYIKKTIAQLRSAKISGSGATEGMPMQFRSGAAIAVTIMIAATGLAAPRNASARARKMSAAQSPPVMATHEQAPCPRGTWKDDPVCFGEGEQGAVPVPSSGSVASAAPSSEPTIKPSTNINPRPSGPGPYQAGVVYQPNGNPVTSNYGGSVSVQLPF